MDTCMLWRKTTCTQVGTESGWTAISGCSA